MYETRRFDGDTTSFTIPAPGGLYSISASSDVTIRLNEKSYDLSEGIPINVDLSYNVCSDLDNVSLKVNERETWSSIYVTLVQPAKYTCMFLYKSEGHAITFPFKGMYRFTSGMGQVSGVGKFVDHTGVEMAISINKYVSFEKNTTGVITFNRTFYTAEGSYPIDYPCVVLEYVMQ